MVGGPPLKSACSSPSGRADGKSSAFPRRIPLPDGGMGQENTVNLFGTSLALPCGVVRSLLVRVVAAGVLVLGLSGTPGVDVMAASAADCMGPRHDCAKAVLTDCCGQPRPAATTALAVFVTTWSSITKLYWQTTSWTADAPGAARTVDTAFAVAFPVGRTSPPVPPLPPAESLTVLLI